MNFHTGLSSHANKSEDVIGPAVRKLRLAQGTPVTQQDLAGRLAASGIQIDRSALARIERGERLVNDIEALATAAALRVRIQELFEGRYALVPKEVARERTQRVAKLEKDASRVLRGQSMG